ncbi:MAG: phage Gp37/Gp68 family protein [Polyangiaceae bacterium]
MATESKIEWTEVTWNPVRGCRVISPGCTNCYAMKMAHRFSGPDKPYEGLTVLTKGRGPRWAGNVRLVPELLSQPLRWRRSRVVFVNSMSDLFHDDVPLDFILKVFATMVKADQHTYQVLTKRSDRLLEVDHEMPWWQNIWMGVSVENTDYLHRIEHLRATGAAVKFLSLEPLLGPLPALDLEGIDWVIVGGESGPRSRPMDPGWVTDIRDQCIDAGVPFFFKQWGGRNKKVTGRLLDGRVWDEMPVRWKKSA